MKRQIEYEQRPEKARQILLLKLGILTTSRSRTSCWLRRRKKGGRIKISPDDYIEGPPELIAEIVGTSAAYDLHQKKSVYRRTGVLEHLVWITGENRQVWWALKDGEYHEQSAENGIIKSTIFSGLWLATAALLRGEMKTVISVLQQGLEGLTKAE